MKFPSYKEFNESVYNTHFYFAYGSNLSLDQLRMRSVYYDKTPAKLYDYELVFNKVAKKDPSVGMGNIVPKKGAVVEGMVYELDNIAVSILDKSEGVPKHYTKELVEVVLQNGEKMNAFVYIANPAMTKDGLLPTKRYIQKFLVDGEKYLSKEYVEKLKKQPTISPEKEAKFYGVRESRGNYMKYWKEMHSFYTLASLFFENSDIDRGGEVVSFDTPSTNKSLKISWEITIASAKGFSMVGYERKPGSVTLYEDEFQTSFDTIEELIEYFKNVEFNLPISKELLEMIKNETPEEIRKSSEFQKLRGWSLGKDVGIL